MQRAGVRVAVTGRLLVYTLTGVEVVPLTGDARLDALLERLAARGGAVVREDGALCETDEADSAARTAMREGA